MTIAAAEKKKDSTLLIVHMHPSHVSILAKDGSHVKDTSYQNYTAQLLKQVKMDDVVGRRTRYPAGMVFSDFGLSESLVVLYHYARRVKYKLVVYDKETEYNIPLPNMVSELTLGTRDKSMFIQGVKIYCTNLGPDIISSRYQRGFRFMAGGEDYKGGTFHVPLTNMYEGGTICFGNNSLPSIIGEADLTPLNRPYEILTEAPGNRDLPIRGLRSDKEFYKHANNSFPDFFKYWATLDEFPYDQMMEY